METVNAATDDEDCNGAMRQETDGITNDRFSFPQGGADSQRIGPKTSLGSRRSLTPSADGWSVVPFV